MTTNDRLIHTGCLDPSAEFEHWLDRLVREGREAGADPARMRHLLLARADDLRGQGYDITGRIADDGDTEGDDQC